MKIFLSFEDQNRIANQIRREIQELMDRINIPDGISSYERDRTIKDITSVTSRVDLTDKLPAVLKTFAMQHKILL